MIVFPNCKINLGLHIVGKREDGFHNLETVFYPIPFKDVLEIIPAKNNNTGIEFNATGLTVDGEPENNLCIKAYHLLKKDFPQLPSVQVHLHKTIPMGAGLGGGSADAAFMLKMLNDKFQLNLPTSQLINYALQLGSDCPFFVINKPCYATGRGEILQEISLDLSAYKIILINPGIHINTGWAFSKIEPKPAKKQIKAIIEQPVESWKPDLQNDFEVPVFKAHPQIKEIKDSLYKLGAIFAAMSGSGSTVFGIFDKSIDTTPFSKKNYFIKILN